MLLGRLTPLVRSLIWIPAGLFSEPFSSYVVLTTMASAIWCSGWPAWAGRGRELDWVDQATRVVEGAMVLALCVRVVALRRRIAAKDDA